MINELAVNTKLIYKKNKDTFANIVYKHNVERTLFTPDECLYYVKDNLDNEYSLNRFQINSYYEIEAAS